MVLVEFPDLEAARARNASPEYQAIAPLRMRNADSMRLLVEGAELADRRSELEHNPTAQPALLESTMRRRSVRSGQYVADPSSEASGTGELNESV